MELDKEEDGVWGELGERPGREVAREARQEVEGEVRERLRVEREDRKVKKNDRVRVIMDIHMFFKIWRNVNSIMTVFTFKLGVHGSPCEAVCAGEEGHQSLHREGREEEGEDREPEAVQRDGVLQGRWFRDNKC